MQMKLHSMYTLCLHTYLDINVLGFRLPRSIRSLNELVETCLVLRLEQHEFHAYVPGDCLIQSDTNPNVMVVVKNNTIIRV